MTLDRLRAYCLSLPHTTEQIQWEEHLLFKVGGKMFVITTPDDPALPMSLKSTAGEFEEWIERPGIIPAPYLARGKWIKLESVEAVSETELRQLIARSYALVVAGLPKKQQSQLAQPKPGKPQASSAAKARARSKASLP